MTIFHSYIFSYISALTYWFVQRYDDEWEGSGNCECITSLALFSTDGASEASLPQVFRARLIQYLGSMIFPKLSCASDGATGPLWGEGEGFYT